MMASRLSPIEHELSTALLALYEKWKLVRYSNSYFKRMLLPGDPIYKGPVGTVRHLLAKPIHEKSGFERLHKEGKLDWTVEKLLHDTKWHPLFQSWVVERAKDRIRAAGSN
jgi:hypothetical protein